MMHHLLKKIAWSCCLLCSAPPHPLPSTFTSTVSELMIYLFHSLALYFFLECKEFFFFMTPCLSVTFGASRRSVGFSINSYRGVVFLQFSGCSVIFTLYGVSVITVCCIVRIICTIYNQAVCLCISMFPTPGKISGTSSCSWSGSSAVIDDGMVIGNGVFLMTEWMNVTLDWNASLGEKENLFFLM